MGLLVTCPPGTAIADITADNCPVSIGQVQKLIFQRIYETGTTKNSFTPVNVLLKASWDAAMAAADGTKAQITGKIANPVSEPGEPLTYGGGNETPDGIELITGFGPTVFTANLLNYSSEAIKSLKALQGENLGVWLCDEHSRITGIVDDLTTPTAVYPIPIFNLVIGDRRLGGFQEPDINLIRFAFRPNWSNMLKTYTPSDFDPLTDLAN